MLLSYLLRSEEKKSALFRDLGDRSAYYVAKALPTRLLMEYLGCSPTNPCVPPRDSLTFHQRETMERTSSYTIDRGAVEVGLHGQITSGGEVMMKRLQAAPPLNINIRSALEQGRDGSGRPGPRAKEIYRYERVGG